MVLCSSGGPELIIDMSPFSPVKCSPGVILSLEYKSVPSGARASLDAKKLKNSPYLKSPEDKRGGGSPSVRGVLHQYAEGSSKNEFNYIKIPLPSGGSNNPKTTKVLHPIGTDGTGLSHSNSGAFSGLSTFKGFISLFTTSPSSMSK